MNEYPAATELAAYPRFAARIPAVHEESGRYALRFATGPDDLLRIQKLRFEVFNLELGEGFASSYAIQRDEDAFDQSCHHMLVEDRRTGEIVGTYRMQSSEMLADTGFYSSGYFDLSLLEADFLPHAVELGRACIGIGHRNSRVLFLLWRGLAAYMQHNDKRFFFGCCSLTSQDPQEGLRMLRQLERRGHMDTHWCVLPRPGCECAGDPGQALPDDDVRVPRLMRTYLQYGARIAGPPAIDRSFKTIDFLTVFDLDAIDARIRRMFLE